MRRMDSENELQILNLIGRLSNHGGPDLYAFWGSGQQPIAAVHVSTRLNEVTRKWRLLALGLAGLRPRKAAQTGTSLLSMCKILQHRVTYGEPVRCEIANFPRKSSIAGSLRYGHQRAFRTLVHPQNA